MNKLIFLSFLIIAQCTCSFLALSAQEKLSDLCFEINPVYQHISHDYQAVCDAKVIKDLDSFFDPNWIQEFLSVEILSIQDGKKVKATGNTYLLNEEQQKALQAADYGTEIFVVVKYIPNNSMSQNTAKEHSFKLYVQPQQSAHFTEGEKAMNQYLNEKVIQPLIALDFDPEKLEAVKFAIDENGMVVDAEMHPNIYRDERDLEMEKILVEAIKTMPQWTAASFDNGLKQKQEFVFMLGNMKSCWIPTLGVRKLPAE